MMEYFLESIPEVDLYSVWPRAEEELKKAVRVGNVEVYLRDLKARIFGGMNQLWVVKDQEGEEAGFAVTMLYTPNGITATAQIYLAAGEKADALLAVLDQFEAWAVKRGINMIEIVGRKGWESVMRPYGFSHNYTSLVKEVVSEIH